MLAEKFDVDAMLGAQGEQRDQLLRGICVDIAIYEVVALAQPNIDLTDRREREQQAVEYLKELVMKKDVVPWPLRDPIANPIDKPVEYGGRTPRQNLF